jgi:hypothetical protein
MIPFSYNEILHLIYNYPTEFRQLIFRSSLNKFNYYYKKNRYQMILWITINDFIECPEKYDWKTILEKHESPEI